MAMLIDWRTIDDEREKYAAYLCSPEWGKLRRFVVERSLGLCERCRLNKLDHVHHLTYIRKYNELPEDLSAVCRGCHEFVHGRVGIDPKRSRKSVLKRELETCGYARALEILREWTSVSF